jgi:Zn-dependent protease
VAARLPALDILIPSFLILVLSLSVHEAAHAWTANRLGDPTARTLGRLTLNPLAHIDLIGTVLFPLIAMASNLPLIGWAKPVPVSMQHLKSPRRDFAVVAAAGPISNIAMALVGAALLAAIGGVSAAIASTGVTAALMMFRFVQLNVLLAVFNMLPIPPLDGGNVLSGFVPETVARLIDQIRPWGFILLYVLLLSGALDLYVWPIAEALLGVLL